MRVRARMGCSADRVGELGLGCSAGGLGGGNGSAVWDVKECGRGKGEWGVGTEG